MKRWLLVLAACGPKPVSSWVEHEGPQAHATHSSVAETLPLAPARPVDLATLSSATIDELDEATARAVVERLAHAAPAAAVALRAARLAHHRGDDATARDDLAHAASAADAAAYAAPIAQLTRELEEVTLHPERVAVLLPLSGRYGAVGSELRAAIELAPAQGTKWLFLDTKGDPAGATAAVEVAAKQGVIAILGPVGSREVMAASRAAAVHAIPIALLGPEDGADPAAGVFRVVGSPADEGRAVAQLAKADNFPSVAVFAPRDDLGVEASEAFTTAAVQLGLQVVKQGTYDPTGGDVEPDVKQFLDLVPARNPELAEHLRRAKTAKIGWESFSPDITYSLLYIPDRYDRAAIVAAYLPYYNVELRTSEFPDVRMLSRKHGGRVPTVVQLVGGAGWHHASLPLRGGAAVQGALLVDSFPGELGGDLAASFTTAFQQRTQRAPTSAAAEAFDAATLISRARASSSTRAGMRSAISRSSLDDGACGPARMDVDGELARTYTTLEVQGDELVVAP
jgi:branched-chain amino acid transport system substrate-binding protein